MFRRLSLACLVAVAGIVLGVQSSTALAAAREDRKAGAETLWQAFPLDPTGERLDTVSRPEPHGRSEAVRAVPETAQASSERSGPAAALVGGSVAGLLVVAVGCVAIRRRNAPNHRPRSVPLSQTAWPSPRQRILDYWEPSPDTAWVDELMDTSPDPPSPPAPRVEWSSVGSRDG